MEAGRIVCEEDAAKALAKQQGGSENNNKTNTNTIDSKIFTLIDVSNIKTFFFDKYI